MRYFKKNKTAKRIKKFFKKKRTFSFFKKKSKKSFFKKLKLKKKKKINKKNQKNDFYLGIILVSFFVLLSLCFSQIYFLTRDLIYLEALEETEKIKKEILAIEDYTELVENDFDDYGEYYYKWKKEENKKTLAEEVRHLNYLNSHLLKVLYLNDNDFSLQFFKNRQGSLANVAKEARNVQLISSRIANKIDALILFEVLNQNQKDILNKDFNLLEEKIKLIKSF